MVRHHLHSYGYYSLNTEKELLHDYQHANSLEEKTVVLFGLYKFTQAETITFLETLEELDLDDLRTSLLFNLDSAAALLS